MKGYLCKNVIKFELCLYIFYGKFGSSEPPLLPFFAIFYRKFSILLKIWKTDGEELLTFYGEFSSTNRHFHQSIAIPYSLHPLQTPLTAQLHSSQSLHNPQHLTSLLCCSSFVHPSVPMESSVIKRSRMGPLLPRPGYVWARRLIVCLSKPATTLPPTGTMKFLSRLCTNKSTLPAWCVAWTVNINWQHSLRDE